MNRLETKPYYYVGSVILTYGHGKQMQIMEEHEGKQVCIALVPYNHQRRDGWTLARKDALMIVEALNAYRK